VDERRVGRVPSLHALALPEGRHKLELLNPTRTPYQTLVNISAGETLEHEVRFQAVGAPAEGPE
jgi:hypothetical protein